MADSHGWAGTGIALIATGIPLIAQYGQYGCSNEPGAAHQPEAVVLGDLGSGLGAGRRRLARPGRRSPLTG